MQAYFFDISAFMILLCLIYAFFLEKMHKIVENGVVLSSMICVLMASTLGVISYTKAFSAPQYRMLFSVTVEMLTALGIALMVIFVYRISVYNVGLLRYMVFVIIPCIVDIVFCIASSVSGSLALLRVGYMGDLFMLLTGINILVIYKKNSSLERTLMLLIMFVIASVMTVVEMMHPEFEIQRFALSLLIAEEFFCLKNPDEQYEPETGLLGMDSFRESMKRRFFYLEKHKDVSLYVVALAVHGAETFMKLLGDTNEIKLRENVIDELVRIANGTPIYRMSKGTYVFVMQEEGRNEAIRIQNSLNERFKSVFGKDAYEMEIHATTCCIELPEMADSFQALVDLVYMSAREGRMKSKAVIDVKKLDREHDRYVREVDEKVRNAVSAGNLEVYYQPIFSLKEKKFVSAEALIRLHDGDGFIPPDVFIPIAESNGSIIEIDEFVMQQVCRMISDRKIETLGLRYIEINLSVPDMIQEDLPDKLMRYVDIYHIHPSQINIEITETSADTFTGMVEENVRKLSRLGFNFTLDDFGTGYSSLSRIIMMPFNIIKMDKTLVQPPYSLEKERERRNAMTLLESSADMIHRVGSETVAEGVETEEQLNKLKELDAEFIQGFYFARPMPESEFINVVKAKNKR